MHISDATARNKALEKQIEEAQSRENQLRANIKAGAVSLDKCLIVLIAFTDHKGRT